MLRRWGYTCIAKLRCLLFPQRLGKNYHAVSCAGWKCRQCIVIITRLSCVANCANIINYNLALAIINLNGELENKD